MPRYSEHNSKNIYSQYMCIMNSCNLRQAQYKMEGDAELLGGELSVLVGIRHGVDSREQRRVQPGLPEDLHRCMLLQHSTQRIQCSHVIMSTVLLISYTTTVYTTIMQHMYTIYTYPSWFLA